MVSVLDFQEGKEEEEKEGDHDDGNNRRFFAGLRLKGKKHPAISRDISHVFPDFPTMQMKATVCAFLFYVTTYSCCPQGAH